MDEDEVAGAGRDIEAEVGDAPDSQGSHSSL
jgi:hypothetical protein